MQAGPYFVWADLARFFTHWLQGMGGEELRTLDVDVLAPEPLLAAVGVPWPSRGGGVVQALRIMFHCVINGLSTLVCFIIIK